MDMFDRVIKVDDSNNSDDDVQLTMEDGGDDQNSMSGVVTALTLDANGQYQFRASNEQGAITYRVVQVTQGEDGQAQILSGLPSNQGVGQSNGDGATSGTLEAGDARIAYIPSLGGGSGSGSDGHSLETAGLTTIGQLNAAAGPFYVMMASPEVLQSGQRTIIPNTGMTKLELNTRTSRDDRRRATHNEVERRRRDKINSWIIQLSKLVPDGNVERQGELNDILHSEMTLSQISEENTKSKGGILAKACEYIKELQTVNARLAESLKDSEQCTLDYELLRQQCEELKQENALLCSHLQQHGIEPRTAQLS